MIKNFNLTLSVIALLLTVIFTIKVGFGTMFSYHRKATYKGNWELFKKYTQNEEE